MDRTITIRPEGERELPRRGFLTVAFVASRPTRRPLRFDLGGVRRVALGRGSARQHHVDGEHGLRVDLDDPTMSQPHAVLERTDDGWVLTDPGSKNGTIVDGVRTERARLVDGAVIAMGETFAVFRSAAVEAGPLVLDGEQVAKRPPALRTMHPGIEEQLRRVQRAAGSKVAVLVLGETGTGKELIARAIHELSGRDGEFVAINCGAIPEAIMTSELFGVRRGAYSGATADRPGLVRAADGGTLLLDEIGEMGMASQVALLRVLQEHQVTPVGDTTPVPVDVRVIAATHRDLRQMSADGRFRDDLLARLAGLVVSLPPLRQRREDLGHMIADTLARSGAPEAMTFTSDAAHLLFSRAWKRNVRELEQAITAAIASGASRIERAHLEGLGDDDAAAPVAAAPKGPVQAEQLAALLDAHGGNLSAVARALSTSRTQVARLIERFGLGRDRKPT